MTNSRIISAPAAKQLQVADTSTPVLVVNLTTHGPLAVIRSLGRLGIPMNALHSDDSEPGLYSRYLKRAWRWTFPSSAQGALETLAQISREIGRRTILLPTSDETSIFVTENQETLRQWFDFPQQPPALPQTLSDKREMYFLAKEHNVPTPEAVFPRGRGDVLQFAGNATFPLMLKAIDGARSQRRTGRKMVIVHDAAELIKCYDALEDPDDPNFMLQEYIPGGDDTIWMFNGYFNENSDCLYGVTGRKLRQYPVGHGSTSLGICLQHEAADQTTRRFMKAIGYRGILDVGYRWDARDGQCKVLDINPRIGSTFRLFTAENGLDVARALYLDLTGQPVPQSKVQEGRKWIVEEQDFKSSLESRRQGQLTIRQWLRSLRHVEESAYFARDDLRPFWNMLSREVLQTLKHVLTRTRPRASRGGRPGLSCQLDVRQEMHER
jgi:predicted ATP-grasp superfamily ATP-dependent carboligase